jgi:hypothetical protein
VFFKVFRLVFWTKIGQIILCDTVEELPEKRPEKKSTIIFSEIHPWRVQDRSVLEDDTRVQGEGDVLTLPRWDNGNNGAYPAPVSWVPPKQPVAAVTENVAQKVRPIPNNNAGLNPGMRVNWGLPQQRKTYQRGSSQGCRRKNRQETPENTNQ